MNHYVAFQPPHLHGKWQYAILNSRGGGPLCGCGYDDGHDTREEAERHFYETYMADPHVHQFDDDTQQRRCEVCGEWTQHRVTVRVHHIHDDVHAVCPTHAATLDIRALVPFRPGLESWGTT